MKITEEIRFRYRFGTILAFLVLNNKTVGFSEGAMKVQPCKAVKSSACVVQCRDCDLGTPSGVAGLKEILQAKRKKFKTCALIFERCTHKSETVNSWGGLSLSDGPEIDDLKIFHSSIDINELDLKLFDNLRRLAMKNTTMASLRPEVYRAFPRLQRLQLKRNKFLKWTEYGFLQNLTLDSLQIQGVDLSQKETVEFFKNLTGEREVPSVRELDWSHNNFGNFPKNLLTFFPNLKVLILTNCSISGFEDGTFEAGNLTSVYVNKNKIQKLSENTFRTLIESSSFVSLEGNQLVCDCEMEWAQSWVRKKEKNFRIDCAIPKGKFLNVEMCPGKNSENSSSVHCSAKENSEIADEYNVKKSSMKLSKSSNRFAIANDDPELIEIILSGTIDLERAFLWYGNYENATSPKFNCLKILQHKFTIYVKPDVNYLICLATVYKYFQTDVSDCLPLKTKPLHEDQPWLTKKSITLSIISIFVVFLFALATGALILYLSVRKNPSLIRGSKRVIEVKRHDKAQILIMPRGYENLRQSDRQPLALASPHLPLQPSTSCDTISTVSYVSANQPTQLEILTYRLSRLRELFQRNNNLPSPVSSLPMQISTPINQRLPPNVDLLFEYEWYTITTTTTTEV